MPTDICSVYKLTAGSVIPEQSNHRHYFHPSAQGEIFRVEWLVPEIVPFRPKHNFRPRPGTGDTVSTREGGDAARAVARADRR